MKTNNISFLLTTIFAIICVCGGRCDRILWYGKGVEQLHYIRSESKFSDHRPVSALFSTQIEIKSSSRGLVELHNIPPTMLHSNHVSAIYVHFCVSFYEIFLFILFNLHRTQSLTSSQKFILPTLTHKKEKQNGALIYDNKKKIWGSEKRDKKNKGSLFN